MASSRWKRFAFFDRHYLTIPTEVLDDLIPLTVGDTAAGTGKEKTRVNIQNDNADSSDVPSTTADEEATRSTRSSGQDVRDHDSVSLIVTTAALPFLSKPSLTTIQQQQPGSNSNDNVTSTNPTALESMWSSLTACTSPYDPHDINFDSNAFLPSIELPSQGQQSLTSSSSAQYQHDQQKGNRGNKIKSNTAALDGLVLCFVTSRNTQLVHCFDLTIRCNPPVSSGSMEKNDGNNKKERSTALEELDGWRGYFAPFPPLWSPQQQPASTTLTSPSPRWQVSLNDNTVDSSNRRVFSTASCRCPDKHRPVHVACISNNQITVWEDPHLHLIYRRPLSTNASSLTPPSDAIIYTVQTLLPQQQQHPSWTTEGGYRVVDIVPGMVAIGTNHGVVLIYIYNYSSGATRRSLRPYLRIPSPTGSGLEVVSVKLSLGQRKAFAFVSYNRNHRPNDGRNPTNSNSNTMNQSTVGICCYEIPLPTTATPNMIAAPSARHDLDGRYVSSTCLVDSYPKRTGNEDSYNDGLRVTVARPDGLYSYSQSERIGVSPIDGTKNIICLIPPPVPAEKRREIDLDHVGGGTGYALVASTDAKSGRDAVDIYDATNKLVAFHLLLSPGHRALFAAGITTIPISSHQNRSSSVRGGRSSSAAVVLSSGGSLVTLTEKRTEEKISLLVQKNLYSAAIVVAYADPAYEAAEITALYQTYAEHLYKKGDFSGAIEQYMQTIGSLESSHVIFRYLDAPKIPLLVKYLEKLRSLTLATAVHLELLRTCYLKLNDTDAADAIAVSNLSSQATRKNNNTALAMSSILSNLATNPKEALATICSLEAPHAAEILVVHGPSLARALPRETAGIVISLCLGTFSPKALAEASVGNNPAALSKMLQYSSTAAYTDHPRSCEPYPVQLFLPSTFVEHPKMLRLVLAHCNRNKCPLTPSLRRTLLELTLTEWNQARRTGDTEAEKLRHREAIAALTDSHSRDIGDYDALVIVQQAGFDEGELLLYERLQMIPMLLERYAADGSEKARRQMLAMCQTDPEILADVLSHFVSIASEKIKSNATNDGRSISDDGSENDEAEEIMEEIQECLALAKRQGVLPPVRIARILAGEHSGQFSNDRTATRENQKKKNVPLSVALEYVGTILEESRKEISRLKSEVEEYNQLCNSMENELHSLLRVSQILPPAPPASNENVPTPSSNSLVKLSIDDLYAKVRADDADQFVERILAADAREAFWREMNQSEDSFETISRFFAKGVIN